MSKSATAFLVKHALTGLCLGIRDNACYDGGEAVLVSASGEDAPRWRLQSEQNAQYIINAATLDKCLNVAYESTETGASLQQWSCNGGASELWIPVEMTHGNYLLINKNSGLAVRPQNPDSGSPIIQTQRDGEYMSQWTISRYEGLQSELILADEMIYNIYVPIYSQASNLSAVTQDLSRIAALGFSTILLMPIHRIGVATGSHPACGSPYAVADFRSVEPALGQLQDFSELVSLAHVLGLKVIMDVVLNHTAWTHPWIAEHPEYYVHTNGKRKDPKSIAQAFWFEDVAQLDYKSGGVVHQEMAAMLCWWMEVYKVDGFRFDTVDNPSGPTRMVPASIWSYIGKTLKTMNPKIILLGECTNPDLSLKPFNIDYTNYSLQPAVVEALGSGDARRLRAVLDGLKASHPKGMLHTSIMQTWDMDLDLTMYGGLDATLVAAVFNFTIEGVPMLFAGEEVGNDRGGVNTHSLIKWSNQSSKRFQDFYKNLSMLRRHNDCFRRGDTGWLETAGIHQGLIAFTRTYNGQQCLVAINFSTAMVEGRISCEAYLGWSENTPPGAGYPIPHPSPPHIRLGPRDFAIFSRGGHGVR